jgi:hypothetical protein
MLDRNTTRWELVPIVHLVAVLIGITPTIFTTANVKEIVRRNKKAESQKQCLQYVEFLTGFSPASGIPGGLAQSALIKIARSMAAELGNRHITLIIPTTWETNGFYIWRISEQGELFVKQRFENVEVKLVGFHDEKKQFFIHANWSEHNAQLHEDGGFFQQPLFICFDRKVKKAKSHDALEDAPASSKKRARKGFGAMVAKGSSVTAESTVQIEEIPEGNVQTVDAVQPSKLCSIASTELVKPVVQVQLNFKPKTAVKTAATGKK